MFGISDLQIPIVAGDEQSVNKHWLLTARSQPAALTELASAATAVIVHMHV